MELHALISTKYCIYIESIKCIFRDINCFFYWGSQQRYLNNNSNKMLIMNDYINIDILLNECYLPSYSYNPKLKKK